MKARITPNAKRFQVKIVEGVLKVRLCAKAEGGRANEELVHTLSKMLGAKVFILRGLKSRDKEIVVEGLTELETAQKVKSLSRSK
ncbi:TPA: DUF167 domain-containing protein [Candidatus Micrarchaeota archaeon]|nr:DUF167 domain-containing protein [Candidatus Micrarchaeota archaeon]